MLEMTATVSKIDSQHVKLTNVKKYAYYSFPDQLIKRGNWSTMNFRFWLCYRLQRRRKNVHFMRHRRGKLSKSFSCTIKANK